MNELKNQQEEDFNLDDLENQLTSDLENSFEELEFLKNEELKIGDPISIGETMEKVIWQQFQDQIGVQGGKNFIEDNNDKNFDPRKRAHIQTTENFAEGKIAHNNSEIDYQKRYDYQQTNFQKNKDGAIKTYTDRTGKTKEVIQKGARKIFDKDRPSGSLNKGTDMDHTVSAGEIIRDLGANAHMTQEEQIQFANSDKNLNEMSSSHNRSKGDKEMKKWLDNPNSKGQKPKEIFNDLDKKKDKQYRKKDKEAREEFERRKEEGEQRSNDAGKRSRVKEVKKMAKHGLKAVLMGLLADLLKTVIKKLVQWFQSNSKSFSSFIDQMKIAVKDFFSDFKRHLKQAADTFLTSVASAVLGPIVRMIKKAWMFLKQGWKSLKEAINYIRDPKNKNKSFSEIMLNVSKIIIAGLTIGGTLVLGEVIEKGLLTIPILAIEIPLLGSISSIMGIFLGGLIAGIVGALGLNMIDRLIAKKQKQINTGKQLNKKNEILEKQDELINVTTENIETKKKELGNKIDMRHKDAENHIRESVGKIFDNNEKINSDKDFDSLFGEIDKL